MKRGRKGAAAAPVAASVSCCVFEVEALFGRIITLSADGLFAWRRLLQTAKHARHNAVIINSFMLSNAIYSSAFLPF